MNDLNLQSDKRIFVIDSGKSNLKPLLEKTGFQWFQSTDYKTSINEAKKFNPNLILGDFYMQKQESLINQLRSDHKLNNVPVILCANKKNIATVIRKINGNVNDYLVKPFEKEELKARIERVIFRHEIVLNTNPLSHLPGNISIKAKVNYLNKRSKEFSFIYLDLDNFKAFNDYYGYSKGDEVIKFVADLCSRITFGESNGFDSFVGHIGGDDFVIIRKTERIEEFCDEIIKEFDLKIRNFYSHEDMEKGFITTLDRKGNLKKFPLMTVTLAVVVNDKENIMHFGEISLKGSEIKKYLKSLNGSNYLIDRRIKKKTLTAA